LHIARDGDCLVLKDEVSVVISGCCNVAPEELCVKCFVVDKGGKIMEVVPCGVESDDNCSVDCTKGDDD
jgi:hypothetical protein